MTRPLVIAHRGASGSLPEHTLAAYALAIEQGADFIEPDLVSTRDGVLVARHENEISGTTDIARRPEFAHRRTTRSVDGRPVTGWFVEDLSLAELKSLRARERLPHLRPASAAQDGRHQVPSLAEILDLVRQAEAHTGRRVGLYPETKHPSHFRALGLPLEEPLLAALNEAGYRGADDPVFIQSFEVGNLKALRRRTALRLVQLMEEGGGPWDADRNGATYAAMATAGGLAAIADYADAIGPAKTMIVPRDAAGRSLAPTRLVAQAHAAGLKVHVWTFRNENGFLPAELRRGADPARHGNAAAEYRLFGDLGVDGLFTDFPATAIAALDGDQPR